MASVEVSPATRAEWAPANPWFWMVPGLGATTVAFLLAQILGDGALAVRFLLICLGLLAAGVALWIRLRSPQDAFVDLFSPDWRRWTLTGMAGIGGVLALTPTLLLLMSVGGMEDLPWTRAGLVLMTLLVAPWGAWMGLMFWRRMQRQGSVSRSEECAALLTLGALTAFAASWALYLGAERAAEWDSMRLAFAVLALVALVAAPLMVVARGVRRAVIGILVVLHFGGIVTAVMAAPPAPWLAGQIWFWFYRPYLQFMYLNNAYHFYAPEPGPATYLWFRIESVDAQHHVHSHWLKTPDIDDNTGKPRYRLALDYQRMLAMTESTSGREITPPVIVMGPDGKQHWAPFYDRRLKHAVAGPAKVGEDRPESNLIVPLPEALPLSHFQMPNWGARRFVQSYARFVMHQAAARDPALTPVRVKVYRVVHNIDFPQHIAAGKDPCYPTLFIPFYMGEFDREGKMTNEGAVDPFLYWLLPIVKKEESKGDSEILAYVFKHAGEPGWILDTTQTKEKTKLKLPEDR